MPPENYKSTNRNIESNALFAKYVNYKCNFIREYSHFIKQQTIINYYFILNYKRGAN